MNWFLALLALLAGIAGLALGEADDSPGLQLIGAVLVLTAVVTALRHVRHRRPRGAAPHSRRQRGT